MSPRKITLPDESRTSFSVGLSQIPFDPRWYDPPPPYLLQGLDEKRLIAAAKLHLEHQTDLAKLRMEESRLKVGYLQKMSKLISGMR